MYNETTSEVEWHHSSIFGLSGRKELENNMDKNKIEQGVRAILEGIGEDPNREGLLETPARVARACEELFAGLHTTAENHLSKTFEFVNENIVIEKNIHFYSLCEHHLLPFYGEVDIAYIPNGKVAGLSKLARTVEVYAKRPQIQERMTEQIANALQDYLDAKGVLVVAKAEHMCMTMRGIKKPGTQTVTACALGSIKDDENLKTEVYRLMKM